mmetsp:Transcript_15211/g.52018  ORF Transcript_15211/g.52018 Transcript_15211/m.52018 type:complete len:282 (+) Transcript_15211:207-1052(+)
MLRWPVWDPRRNRVPGGPLVPRVGRLVARGRAQAGRGRRGGAHGRGVRGRRRGARGVLHPRGGDCPPRVPRGPGWGCCGRRAGVGAPRARQARRAVRRVRPPAEGRARGGPAGVGRGDVRGGYQGGPVALQSELCGAAGRGGRRTAPEPHGGRVPRRALPRRRGIPLRGGGVGAAVGQAHGGARGEALARHVPAGARQGRHGRGVRPRVNEVLHGEQGREVRCVGPGGAVLAQRRGAEARVRRLRPGGVPRGALLPRRRRLRGGRVLRGGRRALLRGRRNG